MPDVSHRVTVQLLVATSRNDQIVRLASVAQLPPLQPSRGLRPLQKVAAVAAILRKKKKKGPDAGDYSDQEIGDDRFVVTPVKQLQRRCNTQVDECFCALSALLNGRHTHRHTHLGVCVSWQGLWGHVS